MSKIITEKHFQFNIPDGKKKERIDLYLTNSIEKSTRSKIQKLIREGFVTVNGKIVKQNFIINPGDVIDVRIPVSPRPEEVEPEDIPLKIVFEDDDLIIINKAPGVVVHPALGNYSGTIVNALLHHTSKLSKYNEPIRAGIIHRIDKDTSGLLVVAKDEWVHAQLAKDFSKHNIERKYLAVCWGHFPDKTGEIIGNIARSKRDRKIFCVSADEGKPAHTFYKVLEEYEFLSLVELQLKTGRTHQIRVHMSHIHHPVFGDPVYGGRAIHFGLHLPKIKSRVNNLLELIPRQALHAKTLGFVHPRTGEKLLFDSELPDDFSNLLAAIKN